MKLTYLFISLSLLFGGCAERNAQPGRDSSAEVTGLVTYSERIALPPDAVVHVALVDAGERGSEESIVAHDSIPSSGRQVPIPFALSYDPEDIDPDRRYAVHAWITDGSGEVRWATPERYPVITKGNPSEAEIRLNASAVSPSPRSHVFQCGDVRLTAYFEREAVRLALPDRSVTLPQVISASGARYASDSAEFWNKGDTATLTLDGTTYDCRVTSAADPWEEARQAGVDFRALGQEPGWWLEIREGERIEFSPSYGTATYTFRAPEKTESAPDRMAYTARSGDTELEVVVTDEPCTDTMSGEAFEHTVVVQFDGREYRGCGRLLD